MHRFSSVNYFTLHQTDSFQFVYCSYEALRPYLPEYLQLSLHRKFNTLPQYRLIYVVEELAFFSVWIAWTHPTSHLSTTVGQRILLYDRLDHNLVQSESGKQVNFIDQELERLGEGRFCCPDAHWSDATIILHGAELSFGSIVLFGKDNNIHYHQIIVIHASLIISTSIV